MQNENIDNRLRELKYDYTHERSKETDYHRIQIEILIKLVEQIQQLNLNLNLISKNIINGTLYKNL